MEDLLTIILVVIVIVFKVRNSIKKMAEEATSSPAEQPTDWEGEFSPYVVVEEDELVEDTEKKSKIEQMMAMLEKSKNTQQAPMPKVKPKPVAKPTVTRKAESRCEHNISRELRSTQGARRAFIYSEIFKKKYE